MTEVDRNSRSYKAGEFTGHLIAVAILVAFVAYILMGALYVAGAHVGYLACAGISAAAWCVLLYVGGRDS